MVSLFGITSFSENHDQTCPAKSNIVFLAKLHRYKTNLQSILLQEYSSFHSITQNKTFCQVEYSSRGKLYSFVFIWISCCLMISLELQGGIGIERIQPPAQASPFSNYESVKFDLKGIFQYRNISDIQQNYSSNAKFSSSSRICHSPFLEINN